MTRNRLMNVFLSNGLQPDCLKKSMFSEAETKKRKSILKANHLLMLVDIVNLTNTLKWKFHPLHDIMNNIHEYMHCILCRLDCQVGTHKPIDSRKCQMGDALNLTVSCGRLSVFRLPN